LLFGVLLPLKIETAIKIPATEPESGPHLLSHRST
jgi:hypothetical protein